MTEPACHDMPAAVAESDEAQPLHRIVVVGGGAGGLELATRLGDHLGRRERAEVALVDSARAHVWKPLLHEVAAGSLDPGEDELSYLAQAHWHGFRYRQGEMIGLDRARKQLHLAATFDDEGREVTPPCAIGYDTLVIAIGSVTRGIEVRTGARVVEVTADGLRLADGSFVDSQLVVWAAGIKGPAVLRNFDGLEVNRAGQLVVEPTLQTTCDSDIFAIGDCADCRRPGMSTPVPPRAQAAHQQASHMLRQIERRGRGAPLVPYTYRDFGSLVSLGRWSTVGHLMGFLSGRGVFIEGYFAGLMYRSLRLMHERALHGAPRAIFGAIARAVSRRYAPPVKLH